MSANLDMAAEGKRAEWTSPVAATSAQQLKSAGRIPTPLLLREVLVTEAKDIGECMASPLAHVRNTGK